MINGPCTRAFYNRRLKQSKPSLRTINGTGASRAPAFMHTTSSPQSQSGQRQKQMLRMLMFGKPGAGKGTLSTRLVKKYDVSFVPCGDILRQNIKDRTDVGTVAEKIMAAGDLVPDELMTKVVTSKLDSLSDEHWILDGFPRTQGQGKLLDEHLEQTGSPLSLIVILDVPDHIILDRISNRWIHEPSGRIYNMSYNAPSVAGKDNITGEPLTKRPDDKPEIFSKRLENYYKSTSPLVSYFESRQNSHMKVVSLTGKTSDEIWPQLVATVEKWFPLSLREK